jgi:hypothetical protein
MIRFVLKIFILIFIGGCLNKETKNTESHAQVSPQNPTKMTREQNLLSCVLNGKTRATPFPYESKEMEQKYPGIYGSYDCVIRSLAGLEGLNLSHYENMYIYLKRGGGFNFFNIDDFLALRGFKYVTEVSSTSAALSAICKGSILPGSYFVFVRSKNPNITWMHAFITKISKTGFIRSYDYQIGVQRDGLLGVGVYDAFDPSDNSYWFYKK